jgi:hypothetical protein
MATIASLLDEDGLITSELLSLVRPGVFSIKNKYVFPVWEASRIIDYVFDQPELWKMSRLALTNRRGTRAGGLVFGLTFQQAIGKLTHKGYKRGRFYCPVPDRFSDKGQIADLLASVYTNKEANWVLEVWQGIGDDSKVYYAHAIVQQSSGLCTHFDMAIIGFPIADKVRLFAEARKIKSHPYTKIFRMDGSFSMDVVHKIANRFFPVDELIDEFFAVEPL